MVFDDMPLNNSRLEACTATKYTISFFVGWALPTIAAWVECNGWAVPILSRSESGNYIVVVTALDRCGSLPLTSILHGQLHNQPLLLLPH